MHRGAYNKVATSLLSSVMLKVLCSVREVSRSHIDEVFLALKAQCGGCCSSFNSSMRGSQLKI